MHTGGFNLAVKRQFKRFIHGSEHDIRSFVLTCEQCQTGRNPIDKIQKIAIKKPSCPSAAQSSCGVK